MVAKYGPEQSYQLAPRAQIFRRDNGNVVDMNSLQYIMRYNDFEHDPYAHGDPWNAICSRGDLAASGYVQFAFIIVGCWMFFLFFLRLLLCFVYPRTHSLTHARLRF